MKSLAERIAKLTPEQRALLALRRKKMDEETKGQTIQNVTGDGPFPASMDQAALWFFYKMDPTNPAYNIGSANRVLGHLEPKAMHKAFNHVIARHELLRTRFIDVEGKPHMVVEPELELPMTEVDLTDMPKAARLEASKQECARWILQPFDVETGPCLRLIVIKLDEADHIVLAVVHHLLTDWWSFQVLFSELYGSHKAFSEHREPRLPELPIQFKDYAAYRNDWRESQAYQDQLNYWLQRLNGAPTVLDMPIDKPRPAVQSHAGARDFFTIDEQLTQKLRGLSREINATTLMTLLAANFAFFSRYTGQTDLLVGSSTTNRELPELGRMLGYLLNILLFRGELGHDPTFRQFLSETRSHVMDAFNNKDLPFQALVEALNPPRDLSRMPLYQLEFIYVNYDGPLPVEQEDDGFQEVSYQVDRQTTGVDFQVSFLEFSDRIEIWIEYATALFFPETVNRIGSLMVSMFESLTAHPDTPISRVPLLETEERARQLREWNQTAMDLPAEPSVLALIATQAERTPSEIAVVDRGRELTYAALMNEAACVSGSLRAAGVKPGGRVGVAVNRSAAMVSALLGIWHTGAAYVPLDPSHPAERLRFVAEDAGLNAVVRDGACDWLPAVVTDLNLDACLTAEPASSSLVVSSGEAPAYAIYTSGSTGRPKGVIVPHRAVINFLLAMAEKPGLSADDRLLAVTTLSFDIAGLELYLPLIRGARTVVADKETTADAHKLIDALSTFNISVMQATPATWQMLFAAGWQGDTQLRCFCGGEALPRDLADRLAAHVAEVWNLYGPTETAIWSARQAVPGGEVVRIGHPIENTQIYIVDRHGEALPTGFPGELVIGGSGVAHGYNGRPGLTAERFVPDALGGERGARLYRTGDLAKRDAGGVLVFLGRLDFQVKVRGFRIEPGEIETALIEHPAVSQAHVIARGGSGGTQLIAYMVRAGREGDDPDIENLRGHLRGHVPDYMLPNAYVFLDALPLTPNGKIDRASLPEPAIGGGNNLYIAPRDATEQHIARFWEDVLGMGSQTASVEISFFELGGHSLLATQVLARIRGQFGVDIPLTEFFREPKVAALAAIVRGGEQQPTAPRLRTGKRPERIPLSWTQERMWFLDKMAVDGAINNMPAPVRLSGTLDRDLLQNVLNALVARHETLRTRFLIHEEDAYQHIDAPQPVNIRVIQADSEDDALEKLATAARERFDLQNEPALRVTLFRITDNLHFLLLNMHHIVSDGWSLNVLFTEFAELYRAGHASVEDLEAVHPPLTLQFADYAIWQRAWMQDDTMEAELDHWKNRLDGRLSPLRLPLDKPRPAKPSYSGKMIEFQLPPSVIDPLQNLAKHNNTTLFLAMLSLYHELLARYAEEPAHNVGIPLLNRNMPELENLIGLFINQVAVHHEGRQGLTFNQLIAATRDIAMEAMAHGEVPFGKVVEHLQPERDTSRTPVFQTHFTYTNTGQIEASREVDLAGLSMQLQDFEYQYARFDLTLFMWPEDGGLGGTFEYATDLFEENTILRMIKHLQELAETAAANPDVPLSQVSMLPADERETVLREFNQSKSEFPRQTAVHCLFEAQAAASPGAPALLTRSGEVSYGELNASANRLANHLIAMGVTRETPVAIQLEDRAQAVTAMLAVLKSGGAYLPLDPAYPAERIDFMVGDAGVILIVTDSDDIPTGIMPVHPADAEAASDQNPDLAVDAAQSAYLMYTSGSTGHPKGAAIPHRAIVRLVRNTNYIDVKPEDVFIQAASIAFDAATLEIWAPLLNGAKLAVPADIGQYDLSETIQSYKVTHLWLTAQLFNVMVDDTPETFTNVRKVLAGGERLSVDHVQRFLEKVPNAALLNGYGPTENTTFTTTYDIREGGITPFSVPIGKPIGNTSVYIVDRGGQPSAMGVPGRLLTGGDGLARGYFGRAARTALAFVPDHLSGEEGARLYDTGDLARWLVDGRIEFSGRADRQIKLRGFRIEPGEIEAQLKGHNAVKNAYVRYMELGSGAALVAYIQPVVEGTDAPAADIANYLAGRLPDYMIPTAAVTVDSFPMTANGKLDVTKLPDPSLTEDQYIAPETDLEETVLNIYRELLELPEIGMSAHFFNLGGHSLLAIRAIMRLREQAGFELGIGYLFEHPIAADLARHLEAKRFTQQAAELDDEDFDEEGEI